MTKRIEVVEENSERDHKNIQELREKDGLDVGVLLGRPSLEQRSDVGKGAVKRRSVLAGRGGEDAKQEAQPR